MLDPAIAGGGPLRNIGIHLTDMLGLLLGGRDVRVVAAALTRAMHGEPIEDFVAATLRTDDGVVATLEVGYSFARPKPGDLDVHIAGTSAYVLQRRDELQIYPAEGEPETIKDALGTDLYRAIFFDALRRLRAGEPPVATIRDCARANALIDAIYTACDESGARRGEGAAMNQEPGTANQDVETTIDGPAVTEEELEALGEGPEAGREELAVRAQEPEDKS